ncbi:MAG: hypothetical protein M3512_10885 [Bacteroidota bacterium]|nr:hypothetical protein [Bacteroidota bacterium]
MVIKVKKAPSNEELVETLKREFSNDYSYKLFGLGKKSIIVRKSAFLGAQVSVQENEISIQGSPPSFGTGFLATLAMTEAAIVVFPLFLFTGASPSKFRKLEKEIASFLKNKYD